MVDSFLDFWSEVPAILRLTICVGGPMLLTFVLYVANRKNPNTWYNRLKRYDSYENRIKFLEERVRLLEQEKGNGTAQKSSIRPLKDS